MGRRRWIRVVAAAACVALAAGGCGTSKSGDDAAKGPTTTAAKGGSSTTTGKPKGTTTTLDPNAGKGDDIPDEPSGPASSFTNVSDPVNDAFSVDVPDGWDNIVYSTVEGQTHHEVVNSISPDGKTVLFIGDPKIPTYWNPDTADPITVQFAEQLEFMELRHYVAAPDWVREYAERKFSKLPGFQITDVVQNTATEEALRNQFANAGLAVPEIAVSDLFFEFDTEDAGKAKGVAIASTINSGPFWAADVLGLVTDGEVDTYRPMLRSMTQSKQTKQTFIDGQNARHQQTMADIQARTEQMTRDHQARMQAIQISAQNHQSRMQAMWDANDASVQGFYDRMASSDASHRNFINYINEEETVAAGGQNFQVDNSYQRYWVNTNTGQYLGGDINFDDRKIREMGLNPDDYTEAQILR